MNHIKPIKNSFGSAMIDLPTLKSSQTEDFAANIAQTNTIFTSNESTDIVSKNKFDYKEDQYAKGPRKFKYPKIRVKSKPNAENILLSEKLKADVIRLPSTDSLQKELIAEVSKKLKIPINNTKPRRVNRIDSCRGMEHKTSDFYSPLAEKETLNALNFITFGKSVGRTQSAAGELKKPIELKKSLIEEKKLQTLFKNKLKTIIEEAMDSGGANKL